MIKNEWKSLLKNKILLVVLIAIIAIPFIYAGLFLKSMWDPYGNLDKLPVAVVNEDVPVEYEGNTLCIGDDLTEALKDNDTLDFHFVDSEKAGEGLENGTWYMVITIPEDFSRSAATLLADTPRKMELKYATNPGTNYIASKMSETAMLRIRNEVAAQVTETYTAIVFDRIAQAGRGLSEAADGSLQLADGIDKASAGSMAITKNLSILTDSTLTFSDGADTLTEGLKEYTDGVSRINTGASQLKKGTDSLTASLPALTGGIHTLNNGVKTYTSGVAALNANSPQLLAGVQDLETGAQSLTRGLDTLQTGTDRYVSAVDTFTRNAVLYAQGTEQLAQGAEQLEPLENLDQASSAISLLNASVSEGDLSLKNSAEGLSDNLNSLYIRMQELSEHASVISSASPILEDSAGALRSASGTLSDTASQIRAAKDSVSAAADSSISLVTSCAADGNDRISTANGQLQSAKDTLTSSASSLEAVCEKLSENDSVPEDALASLRQTIDSLDSSAGNIQEISGIETNDYIARAQQISDTAASGLSSLDEALDTSAGRLDDTAAGLEENADSIPDISADTFQNLTESAGLLCNKARQLSAGTAAVSDALTELEAQTENFPAASEGIKKLNTGFDTLLSNNDALLDGADSLRAAGTDVTGGISSIRSGGLTVSDGIQTLGSGIRTYTDGISTLADNSSALTDGTAKLADGAGVLCSGAGQLSDGTAVLAEGAASLVENNDRLNDGAALLADGAGQLCDGASRLYDGSVELDEGMAQLQDGADVLADSLSEGAEEASATTADEDTIHMFASPVNTDETQITTVENNGHAMAPYMMSVGLWVGCLAFCLMYPLTRYNGKLKSGLAWWASKASVLYPVAVLQGLMLIWLLHVIDGFTPAKMTETILFACLTAAAFTSVMYFFNITLGKVGSFLMLIFMVVQLSGSAGTYPVEISPAFVADIHAYLPFTYTVDAFRSTISGGGNIRNSVILLALLTVVFTGLTILQFQHMSRRRKNSQPLLIDWLEEKGLA